MGPLKQRKAESIHILRERIDVVSLNEATRRPVVRRSGAWRVMDDGCLPLADDAVPELRSGRFRTLGCCRVIHAIEFDATSLQNVMAERPTSTTSERQGRPIDHDGSAPNERKNPAGNF